MNTGVPAQQAEVQAETFAEIIEVRIATKQDLIEMEFALKRDMKDSEQRIIIKLGAMIAASIAIIAALVKLL